MDGATGVNGREFFVEDPVETAFETDDRFGGLQVAVDGDVSPRLKGIEHALGGISRGGAEVKVLAQALRFFCFLVQC